MTYKLKRVLYKDWDGIPMVLAEYAGDGFKAWALINNRWIEGNVDEAVYKARWIADEEAFKATVPNLPTIPDEV